MRSGGNEGGCGRGALLCAQASQCGCAVRPATRARRPSHNSLSQVVQGEILPRLRFQACAAGDRYTPLAKPTASFPNIFVLGVFTTFGIVATWPFSQAVLNRSTRDSYTRCHGHTDI